MLCLAVQLALPPFVWIAKGMPQKQVHIMKMLFLSVVLENSYNFFECLNLIAW